MTSITAKGTKGFLIWDFVAQEFVFRVYDPNDKSKFVDYDIRTEELAVEITDDYYSLVCDGTNTYITYTKVANKE